MAERLGTRLVIAREACRLSQEEAADVIGVTQSAISSWESGRQVPGVDTVPKIASALHLPVDELLQLRAADKARIDQALRPSASGVGEAHLPDPTPPSTWPPGLRKLLDREDLWAERDINLQDIIEVARAFAPEGFMGARNAKHWSVETAADVVQFEKHRRRETPV